MKKITILALAAMTALSVTPAFGQGMMHKKTMHHAMTKKQMMMHKAMMRKKMMMKKGMMHKPMMKHG